MFPENLTHTGLNRPNGTPFGKDTEFRVKQLASIIPLIIKPRKTTNKKQTSYGMKHMFSHLLHDYCKNNHSYITNGEFIYAMITAGYQPIRCSDTSPNCYFKADYFPDMKGAPQCVPTCYEEGEFEKRMPNFYEFRKAMMVYKEGTFFTPSQTAEQVDWYNKEYQAQKEAMADREQSQLPP